MFDTLRKLWDAPAVYEESEVSIWQDEHISKQLLQAHLDPDSDGASRKPAFIEKSAAWIGAIAPPCQYPNLVDISCGPGLYAEKFCRQGYRVTGIDFSQRSIQYAIASAKKRALPITYRQQDYLKTDISGAFDFAAFIYCDYGALSEQNRAIVLKKIYQSLNPGGKLLLDAFSMEKYRRFKEVQDWQAHPGGGFWSEKEHVALNRHCQYSEHVTLRQTVVLTAADAKNYYLWDCYFSEESLRKEAREAGFSSCEIFADVAGRPYTKESLTIAALLEKT